MAMKVLHSGKRVVLYLQSEGQTPMMTETLPKVGGSNPPPATNLVNAYLNEIAALRKSGTLRESRRILFAALPYLRDDDPRAGVLAFLASRKGVVSERTRENEKVRLCALYRSHGIEVRIPKIHFTPPAVEVYSDAEITAILNHANGRDRYLYETLRMAGLRMGEAQHLEYSDLTDGGIQVQPHGSWEPKTSECRLIAVPKQLVEELRRLPIIKGSPLVFPTRRGTLNTIMLRTLKRVAVRAGLNPEIVWLHKYRSTFATHLLRRGLPLHDVSKQLGHASISTTQRYLALLQGANLQQRIEDCWK
jgi:integrase